MDHDLTRLGAWADLPFFQTDWPRIRAHLDTEAPDALPPAGQRFAALERTQPQAARVILLGQDPYPTPGHANGLAFSVTPESKLPKSLANIYRELTDDIGGHPPNGDLGGWADQGVLLLNSALSTPPHDAGGHARLGWHRLVGDVLARLSDRPRFAILWGAHAQKLGAGLDAAGHKVIRSAHPSPLSAYRGFFGSKPFSQANAWLTAQGEAPIDWTLAAPDGI